MQDIHFDKFTNIVEEWKEKLKEINNKEEYQKFLDWFRWKVTHSARVSMICKQLASEEEFDEIILGMDNYMTFNNNSNTYQLNKNGIYIASLCGLYHDIGRFPQIVKYHTESDYKCPIDHGTISYQMLKDNNILSNCNLNDDEINIILESVRQHNNYFLDKSNDEKINYFCNLLRDADKIDILKGLIDGNVSINTKENMPLSDGVVDDIINKKQMVIYEHAKNENDRIATMFSYYYDIKTKSGLRLIEEEQLLKKLYNKLEYKDDFKILFETKLLEGDKYVR